MKNPEHRVRTTKKRFREALMGLLEKKPLRSITVKELCLRAGLNRGTFYAHYTDVAELMEQIEAEMEEDFRRAVEPLLSSAETMMPSNVTKKVFECIEANADLCKVTIGPHGDKEFARRLIRSSKEYWDKSCQSFFPDAEPWKNEVYHTFIIGGCSALMERWISEGMVESSEKLAAAAEAIMVSGIAFLR